VIEQMLSRNVIALSVLLAFLGAVHPSPVHGSSVPPVQRSILPNNMVLLVVEDHSLPFVVFEMLLDAGSRRDPESRGGLANLTARSLLLGTRKQDRTSMNESVDFLGAILEASATRDYALLRLQTLKKNLDLGFGLFMEALTAPTFPEGEIGAEVQRTLGQIQAIDERPVRFAEKAFREVLFSGSPYGHPVEGTRDSVPTLTKDDVTRFYQAFYKPNNAVLTVVGDITADEVKVRLLPTLLGWQSAPLPEGKFKAAYAEGPKTVPFDRKVAQASVVMGNYGLRRDDADYYSAEVMNYILGGGVFESYLMEEIRVKKGLAYGVYSSFIAEKYQGSFQVVLQTKNASAREAISIAKQQMERMRKTPVSEKALARAKKYLTGSFPLRVDTQSKLAHFFSLVEYYGLGLDYPDKYPRLINGVTSRDVRTVANKYLHPENAILVVVGDLSAAGIEKPASGNQ
jgi:zinc protease